MAKEEREIWELRMRADALERQMKVDRAVAMGFKGWDNPDLKDGEAVITIRKDFSYGFIPHFEKKGSSFYDMSFWIRPSELSSGNLSLIKRKMKYPALGYLLEYLGLTN